MKRFCVVGFGAVCENAHLSLWKELSDLIRPVGVFDVSSDRRDKAKNLIGINVYDSFNIMIEKEKPDFIVITTPPKTHKDFIIQSIKNNIDVLCEKPLCTSLVDFDEISDYVYANEKIVYTVHNWMYSPHIIKIKEIAKKLGELKYLSWQTLRKKPSVSASHNWRQDKNISGGGIIFDHGWHVAYILKNIVNSEFLRIEPYFEFNNEIDEVCDLRIVYQNGVFANVHLSWNSPIRKNTFFAYGKNGYMIFNDDKIEYNDLDGNMDVFYFDSKISQSSAHPLWTKNIYLDFLKAVDDRKSFEKNFDDARECIRLIEYSYMVYEQRKDKNIYS